MTTEKEPFAGWAIVEVMGHLTLAGWVTEEELFGKKMCRCDIPGDDGEIKITRYVGPDSIYGVTPVAERIARAKAANIHVSPITHWDIRQIETQPSNQGLAVMDDEESFDGEFAEAEKD